MSPTDGDLGSALWDNLPVAAVVLGVDGLIHHANERVYAFSGYGEGELAGRSLFDLIVPEDLIAILDSMGNADGFDDVVLGPFRVRYIDSSGASHWCSAWALSAGPRIGIDGWVVTLSAESCADRLSTALRGIAADADLADSLATVSAAVGASPIGADATLLVDDESGDGVALFGSWPFTDEQFVELADAPWGRHATELAGDETSIDGLPEPLRSEAAALGYQRVWVRPLRVDGVDRGTLVAWRRMDVSTTPNQRNNLDDCLAVAALAIGRRDHRRSLRQAAYSDHLTGLGNRALLELRSSDSTTETAGVLYIDVDDFKEVNDRYGHAVGDAVLQHVGDRLLRVSGSNGEVFRVVGDEFVVVCAPALTEIAIEDLAHRLVDAIGEAFEVDGVDLTTTVSVGVSSGTGRGSVAAMTERADRALIRAKRTGKARWSHESGPERRIQADPSAATDGPAP